jgi:hypothetical protein
MAKLNAPTDRQPKHTALGPAAQVGSTQGEASPAASGVATIYRSCHNYSDLKLRMGPSESSSQSSNVPKSCGRASEVWSGARSALLNLGIQRAHRVAFGRSARSKKTVPSKNKNFPKKVVAGWRRGFCWYERAGERHERTQAVGLGFGGRACIWLSERASLQPPANERAWPMSSIRIISWPSQWRFQISAQIHPKYKLASQSVVIKKAHPNI